jgi:hypothetical protein
MKTDTEDLIDLLEAIGFEQVDPAEVGLPADGGIVVLQGRATAVPDEEEDDES